MCSDKVIDCILEEIHEFLEIDIMLIIRTIYFKDLINFNQQVKSHTAGEVSLLL